MHPRIIASPLSIEQRVEKINHRHYQPDAKHRRSGRRKDIEHLQFFRIRRIASRHSLIPEDKLREESQVKANEHEHRRDLAPEFRVHSAGHLWPPVMDTAEICDHLSADHHVVKVSDDKVCIRQMNGQTHRSEEQSCKSADQEQAHETDRVQHRRVKGY